MRLTGYLIAFLIGTPLCAIAASPFDEDTGLADAIHKCLDIPTFDPSCLDVLSAVVVVDDETQHKYSRDQQVAYFKLLQLLKKPPVISDFEILGEIDDGAFASVTYRYLLTSYVEQAPFVVQMDAQDVWKRGPSGWSRVTSVIRKTGNIDKKEP